MQQGKTNALKYQNNVIRKHLLITTSLFTSQPKTMIFTLKLWDYNMESLLFPRSMKVLNISKCKMVSLLPIF